MTGAISVCEWISNEGIEAWSVFDVRVLSPLNWLPELNTQGMSMQRLNVTRQRYPQIVSKEEGQGAWEVAIKFDVGIDLKEPSLPSDWIYDVVEAPIRKSAHFN